MKTLRILSILLFVFTLGLQNTNAQTKEINLTEEQKEEMAKSFDEYFKALNLTEDQKTKFEFISQKYTQQLVALKAEEGSRFSKYKKVKVIRTEKDREMKSLLNDDQYLIYEDKKREIKEKMKAKRKK